MGKLRLGRGFIVAAISLLSPAVGAQSGGCVAPPAGIIAWWRGEGNGRDSAGTNRALPMNGVAYATGMVGSGFSFSGLGNDYVALPENVFGYPAPDTVGGTPFSLELWFETTNSGGILGQQDAVPFGNPLYGNVPGLYVGTNGALHCAMFWNNWDFIESSAIVNDGQFHHAAVTYDGSTETLYLDGALAGSIPFVQNGYAPDYFYELGTAYTDGWTNTPEGWFPLKGIIDEVSLYNRALTPAEIAAIFYAGSAGKCTPPGPVLMNRYSFNGPAGSPAIIDSVGGAHGYLVFGATNAPYTNGISDGSGLTGSGLLSLHGTNGYVNLPPGLISSFSNLTIEAWITWNGPATSVWQRICDFGLSDHGPGAPGFGTNYVILCPARGGTGLPGFEETTVNPFGLDVDTHSLILPGPAEAGIGQPMYIAVTYDPIAGQCKLFLNGSLVASAVGQFNAMSRFTDVNCWLGRSQWVADPFFNGTYDEFRIWEGILTPEDIASHSTLGPDQPFVVIRPVLNIAGSGATILLSWSASNTGSFKLQTTASLATPNWTDLAAPVTLINSSYEVSLPANGAGAYYRLMLQ